MPPTNALRTGRDALAQGAWEEARAAFETAAAEEETPEALEGLGAAAWWMLDLNTAGRGDGGELRSGEVGRPDRSGRGAPGGIARRLLEPRVSFESPGSEDPTSSL